MADADVGTPKSNSNSRNSSLLRQQQQNGPPTAGDNNSSDTNHHSDGKAAGGDATTTAATSSESKRSVFGDFQRMWMQRFPQSSLSDAWEVDVRASLQRHRQRIGELTNELEQERLYVEYLELLLTDVERQRLEQENAKQQQQQQKVDEEEKNMAEVSTFDDGNGMKTSKSTTSANIDPAAASSTKATANGSSDSASCESKNPALQQCITELSTNLRNKTAPTATATSTAASTAATTSHFVTVIEVKEQTSSTPKTPAVNQQTQAQQPQQQQQQSHQPATTADGQLTDAFVSEPLAAVLDAKKKIPPRPPPKYRRAAPVEPPTVPMSATVAASSVGERAAADVQPERNLKPSDILRQRSSDSLDVKLGGGGGSGAMSGSSNSSSRDGLQQQQQQQQQQLHHHAINRNTNPDAGRQFDDLLADELGRKLVGKAESFERQRRPDAFKRTQSPTTTAFANDATGPAVPQTGSLPKVAVTAGSRFNSSDAASVGSRESLSSSLSMSSALPTDAGAISERIKSFESISSGYSDGGGGAARSVATAAASSSSVAGHQTANIPETAADAEPLYDTVPLDHGGVGCVDDGEYMYIQAAGGGGAGAGSTFTSSSASSRDDVSHAGSTLPMSVAAGRAHPKAYSSQTSILAAGVGHAAGTEPESPGRSSNYVNIDYFLSQAVARHSSMDSDGESDVPPSMRSAAAAAAAANESSGTSAATAALMMASTSAAAPTTPSLRRRKLSGQHAENANDATANQTTTSSAAAASALAATNAARSTSIRNICSSIIGSETLYVDCLNKMMQYMRAIHATLETSQPVISKNEFATMFYKIDELFELHTHFLRQLRTQMDTPSDSGDICIGETFRRLAEHIGVYGAFLHNYGRAIEMVKKCGANNQQFKELVAKIVVNSQNEQSLSLEDLLHKPVARVQKNALVLQDLLNQTPAQHADYAPLRLAQKMIRNFLSEFNVVPTKNMMPSDDKALRRLVKNSFIVELSDNHRKLRHLFLFNDVIACAKYKASGRDRYEYELKWFIPLRDIVLPADAGAVDPKEHNPVNILQLKSQACTVRDQLLLEQREAAAANGGGGGGGGSGGNGSSFGNDDGGESSTTASDKKHRSAGDKHRKKLHDLEAQLVLASPNLVLRIQNQANNKTAVFFLSSDYERSQWIDSIVQLQQSSILPGATPPILIYDLQALIAACQTLLKAEMGSYLLRSGRDESLLVGDLQLTVQSLMGAEMPADWFVCIEVDSYGHYFRKARTKLVCRALQPQWNETFVLELEGSLNVRMLLYEDVAGAVRPVLRAKHVIRLSRQWLGGGAGSGGNEENVDGGGGASEAGAVVRTLRLTDTLQLGVRMRFVPGEVSLRRVPTSKPGALFGAKMQQVVKREKRPFPFILSACIREVDRRGMCEVGVYRVSGSASDLARLKKSFETNNYEAEQLLKEVDIHSVTGILKLYLRELPEALFTDQLYPKFVDVFNSTNNDGERSAALAHVFAELPDANRAAIDYILAHLIRIHQQEAENKMSLHNLAMVFGPTLLRPGPNAVKHKDLLESSTVDVMAQAGILYCFLQARNK